MQQFATVAEHAPPAVTPVTGPVRVPDPVPGPGRDPEAAAPPGCVTVVVDDDRDCVIRLRGFLGRAAIARVDAVLQAVESMPRVVVVDVSRARTRDRRLLRVVADVAARRRGAGRAVALRGVHPDVVPDLEGASLPETFLIYQAVCQSGI